LHNNVENLFLNDDFCIFCSELLLFVKNPTGMGFLTLFDT
jgi:hypothetical protein